MSFARIRPRRGTATQWETANSILAEGEIGIEVPNDGVGTGAVKIKFGDGVTAWNNLPYAVDAVSINQKDVGYTVCERGEKFSAGTAFYIVKNGICYLTLELTPSEKLVNGDIIVQNIPKPPVHFYTALTGTQGNYTAQVNATNGNLVAYYPGVDFVTRFDCTIVYPVA